MNFEIVQNFPRNISIEYDKGYAFFSCIEIMQYAQESNGQAFSLTTDKLVCNTGSAPFILV